MKARASIPFIVRGFGDGALASLTVTVVIDAPAKVAYIPLDVAKQLLVQVAIEITNPDGFEELARSLSSEGGTRLAVVPKPRKANQS